MPDTPLDKLEIQITSSSEGAEKKVNALADALERLSNMSSLKGIEGVAKKISTIGEASKKISITVDPSSEKALDGIIDKVGVLQRAIEKVNATAINIPSLSKQTGGTSKTTAQTVRADDSISGTGEAASGQAEGEKVRENVAALNNVKKSAEEASASINKMKKTLSDQWSTWSSLKGMVQGVKDKILETAAGSEKISNGLLKVIPVVGVIKTVLSGAVSIVKKIGSAFIGIAKTIASGVVTGVKNIASGLKTIGKHVLSYVTKPFTKAIAVIQKWKAALVRVAFYRLVRSAIKMVTDGFKEGIENLYYFSSLTESQFKPAMDSLASSSLYLKNSLGAMAAPLIQAVAPAVNYLIDLFVSLLNVINMVFSVLGGRTYTKALKTSAKYADDLDKSLGGGASSAKELQRYLIGIDQLTIMPDQPNSGGGGGGGADLGSMYDEMFEEVPLPDWVLNIKDAIDAGDWNGAGELLAEKVNTIIDKLKDNAPIWGDKIGQAIQNGIEMSLGFIRKLDIEGVGESITTLIGNALNKIDPRDLGAIIASGIKSAFRFAHGLLQGYTGPEIGSYLANVVNGWFAELRSNGGWKTAAEDLNKVILGIINGVSNFLEGLDTTSIEKDLKDFFGNIKWGDIWDSMAHLAEVAADAVPWQDMLNSLWRFAANVLVFLRTKVLGIPSNQASQPWKDLEAKLSNASETINWADIISGLIAFVGDLVSTIKGKIPSGGWDEIWDSVKSSLSKALGFDNWDSLKTEFSEKVYTVISSALDTALDAVYRWLTSSGSLLGDLAANVFFPDRYQVDKATQNFIGYLKAGSLDAAQAQINAMVQNGNLTAAEAARIAAENGYSYANGLLTALPNVSGAAETITNSVNSSFDKIDSDVDVSLNATKTPEFDTATQQLADTNDKSAELSALVNNKNVNEMHDIRRFWGETDDKTVTLKATVKNANTKVLSAVQSAWSEIENKTVTLTARIVDGASGVRTTMLSAWKDLTNKNASLRATVSDGAPGTRTTMLDAWKRLESKTVTLTARANNTGAGTFTTLLSTWSKLENKTVTLTANANNQGASTFKTLLSTWDALKTKTVTITVYGSTNGSVGSTQNAFNSLYNKGVTVSLYGSIDNSFKRIRDEYNALRNKTITVTTKAAKKESGGVFYGGAWHDIAGYASGGSPRRARLFYANENGIPELIGRIGANPAVMNNGQIVASVSSGVYRAVAAAMGGIGSYFANIATGISRIPEVLSNITPVQPQPILVGANGPTYEMDTSVIGRSGYDGAVQRGQEDQEEIINAIYAMGQRIISAINTKELDVYFDTQRVGSSTTDIQNRQNRMYGKTLQNV